MLIGMVDCLNKNMRVEDLPFIAHARLYKLMHAHTKRWRCSSSTDTSNCTINIKLHLFQLIADII